MDAINQIMYYLEGLWGSLWLVDPCCFVFIIVILIIIIVALLCDSNHEEVSIEYICPNCGGSITKDVSFCPYCGIQVRQP